jgi:putative transposase
LLLRDIKTNQRRYATITKDNVLEFAGRDSISDPLTDLLRSGAQQLINQAVEAELQELLSQHSGRRTEDGNAVVVRNGHLPVRELQTGLGPVTVKIPKVRSKTGEPVTWTCPGKVEYPL